jgi:hypothetical protein
MEKHSQNYQILSKSSNLQNLCNLP